MVKCWLIMKGNFPSMSHARYLDEAEARKEVERLEGLRRKRNQQIDDHPATGRGSAFMNIKDNDPWSLEYREFPA